MASSEDIHHAWEEILHNHPALSRLDQKKGPAHAAQFSQANTASLHAGYSSLQADAKQPFKHVLAAAVADVENTANTFVNDLESFGKGNHDVDDWAQAIDAAISKAQESFKNNIHKSFEDGKAAIRQLPSGQQRSAAEAFSQSMGIVSDLTGQVEGELSSATRHVPDFRRKVWSSLEQIRREAKQWCSQVSRALGV